MGKTRDPIKQIMSEVHKDARAGRVELGGHDGFIAEVKRRIRAAGLYEEDLPGLRERLSTDQNATNRTYRRGGPSATSRA
jgi:hypothetical protein